jgi:hypothetical protein
MAVPTTYLTSVKNTRAILEAMQKASVPKKFTFEFLKQLGYPSSGDRPTLPMLKALGFLDEGGVPTDRYRRYKDPSVARASLAEGMREAYADIFAIDQAANERTVNELKGMFARVSDKGDSVTAKMAMTFNAFADLADFSTSPSDTSVEDVGDRVEVDEGEVDRTEVVERHGRFTLRHDVHVHLPVSTDIAVYDAIFKSLRENLA